MKKKVKRNAFLGNPISQYGLKEGRVDYKALSSSFNAILCNNILDGSYYDLVNGCLEYWEDEEGNVLSYEEYMELPYEEQEKYSNRDNEIYQYFIIDANGYNILREWTDEIVFHIDQLDLYVWGVTHFGTSWDYVLTSIEIEE